VYGHVLVESDNVLELFYDLSSRGTELGLGFSATLIQIDERFWSLRR
jgi:hypothetical protein